MNKNQYTIRNIPSHLDRHLRKQAKKEGKSLNEAVLDTLKRGAGVSDTPVIHTDLDSFIGSWENDPNFDKALRLQDKIDTEQWT